MNDSLKMPVAIVIPAENLAWEWARHRQMQSESFTCQDHLTVASRRLCKDGSRKGRGGQREPFALLALFTPFLLLLAQDAFWHWACSDSTLPNARLLLRMVNKMLTRFLLYVFLGRGAEVFWTAVEETVSRGSETDC